jgi:hypothetical protein
MEVPESFASFVLAKEYVTVEDVAVELGLKEITVRNYLSRMSREGTIDRIGRGRYRVVDHVRTAPGIPPGLQTVLDLVLDSFPDITPVVWAASMVSDYMHNVPGGDLFSMDVSRNIASQLRTFLTDRGHLVFVDPDADTFEGFAWSDIEPIFLFKRGEVFASVPIDGSRVASLDRIWVDLYYLRTRKGLPFPLAELGVMLRNLVGGGAVSIDRMLRYSSRRGLRSEVMIILYELGKEEPDLHVLESVLPRSRNAGDWIEEVVSGSLEGW